MAEAPNAAVRGGDAGVEEIAPQPQPALRQRPLRQPIDTENHPFVYVHFDTTGLEPDSYITQIAARSGQNEKFSTFVLPPEPTSEEAQNIRGITRTGEEMYHHGNRVDYLTIRRALEEFINFLGDEPVILIGHNIERFFCPVLLNALQSCNMIEQFRLAVHGFVDTLPLFRDKNWYVKDYKLETLYQYYTGFEFNPTHNAREAAKALQDTMNDANPDHQYFDHHSFTFGYIYEMQQYNTARIEFLPAWMVLVEQKVISKFMADRASGSGLSWNEVERIFQAEGEEGVRRMLRERLTDRKKIIDSICQFLPLA